MSISREISVSELRSNLPTLLHRTLAFGESFKILKHGQPFAVLSPITDGDEIRHLNDRLTEAGAARVDADEVRLPAPVP